MASGDGIVLVLLVLGATLGRIALSGDPISGMLVPIFLTFHESYSISGGRLGSTNVLYLLMWMMCPGIYVFWLGFWEIISSESVAKKVVTSKDKTRKMLVEHSTTSIFSTDFHNHPFWNSFADFRLNIIGTALEPEYIGNIQPTDYIMDENNVMQQMGDVQRQMVESWSAPRNIMMLSVLILGSFLGGIMGFALGTVIVMFIMASKPRPARSNKGFDVLEVSKTTPLPLSDGIYRLNLRLFDYPKHIGVGYVEDGVLHTRYHVTQGNPIEVDDCSYAPSYVNKIRDNVAYGGCPRIAQVALREEIVVALAGPNSNHILPYKTRAETDAQGNMVFYGNRSTPGCSGSPIFKLTSAIIRNGVDAEVTVTKYVLVGTIGWFYDKKVSDGDGRGSDDRKAVEIAPNDATSGAHHVNFEKGQIVQLFKHPGSGKTRTIAVDLIRDGVNKFGKVYFVGPTRVVCEEAYRVLNSIYKDKVSLCTSSATGPERGSGQRPIMIIAHATALSMLAKGVADVMKVGLWIMDEAHFIDSKTMVLKDYLRHKVAVEKRGALVEMTATGYDILKGTYVLAEGSNAPINDVIKDPVSMKRCIVEDALNKKILVFVTALKGNDPYCAAKLASEIEKKGGTYVILSRETFSTKYKEAKELDVGAILTTDISECGANIHPDIVYDFQMTSKVRAIGRAAMLEKRYIDMGQRIQRRGRVGRNPHPRMPAVYVSPGYDLEQVDLGRIEHHERHAVAHSLGIDIRDPTVEYSTLNDITLTPAQIAVWASMGEGGFNSLRCVHMTTDTSGYSLSTAELTNRINQWWEGDDVSIVIGQSSITCSWWDHRDKGILEKIAAKRGDLPYPIGPKDRLISPVGFLTRVLVRSKPPIINHFGMIRDCVNDPTGGNDADDDDSDGSERVALMDEEEGLQINDTNDGNIE